MTEGHGYSSLQLSVTISQGSGFLFILNSSVFIQAFGQNISRPIHLEYIFSVSGNRISVNFLQSSKDGKWVGCVIELFDILSIEAVSSVIEIKF